MNNLYGCKISQKLPVNGFKQVGNISEFNEDFIKRYNEKSNEGYFLEADFQYPENIRGTHNDLPILLEIKKVDNVKKLVVNFRDKKKYVIHIRNLTKKLG